MGLHSLSGYTIGQLKYELSGCLVLCYEFSREEESSPFSVAKEGFYVVISGEIHGAEYIIIRTCIESTTLYRKARKFSGLQFENIGHVTFQRVTLQLNFESPPKYLSKIAPKLGNFLGSSLYGLEETPGQ